MKIRKSRYCYREWLKWLSNRKNNIDAQHPQVKKELERTQEQIRESNRYSDNN